MKLIRPLLITLLLALALAGLLLAAVCSPIVQTWYVRRVLARQPGLSASVESVWTGPSQVRFERVRMHGSGASLTLPTLEVRLPVLTWLREGRAPVRAVVAKDWVLKFGKPLEAQAPAGAGASLPAMSAEEGARAAAAWFAGLLRGWKFPGEIAIDAVDLEGDVVLAGTPGTSPTMVHVTLKGGRLAAGTTGSFALQASLFDARLPRSPLPLQGELKITMETPRRIGRVAGTGTIVAVDGAPPGAAPYAWEFVAAGVATGTSCHLALAREGRRVAEVNATHSVMSARLAGDWKVDGRAEDWTAIGAPPLQLPDVIEGAGKFDASAGLSRLRLAGHLRVAGLDGKALAPWLERVGPTTMAADFDVRRDGAKLGFDRIEIGATSGPAGATVRLRRPVTLDLATRTVATADLPADWLEVGLRGVPVAWFEQVIDGYTLAGGEVAGDFGVNGAGSEFRIRSKTPCVADGVSLRRGEALLVRGLDLSATFRARVTVGEGVWQVELAPLTFAQGGAELGRIEGKVSRAGGKGKPVELGGQWKLDVAALVAHGVIPRVEGLPGRSASGDFSGTVDGYVDVQGKITATGHDPSHTLNGTVRADLYADGTVAFTSALKVALGAAASDVKVEWEWRGDRPQLGVDLKLAGNSVSLDALGLLAAPVVAFGQGGTAAQMGGRDRRPFWGDWVGRVRVDIDRLRLADQELLGVGGYVRVEPGKIQLLGGHGGPERREVSGVDGELTFEPTREFPYELKATATAGRGNAESVFGLPPKEGDPVFVGQFTVERSLTAKGATLSELIARREETFKLSGKNGIVRMLKAGVAQALPPPPEGSGVMNALDNVGTAFTRLLGAKTKSLSSGAVKVSEATDAVLELDRELAEIGYDNLTMTAIRRADGSVRVPEFDLVAPSLHLTGTGELGRGDGGMLPERPLSAEIRLGLQGRAVGLTEKAGLALGPKDDAGYRWVDGTLHVGGTLKQPDQIGWRARLVEAGTRKAKTEPAKK